MPIVKIPKYGPADKPKSVTPTWKTDPRRSTINTRPVTIAPITTTAIFIMLLASKSVAFGKLKMNRECFNAYAHK